MVVVVALRHRLKPLASLRNGIMHSLTKLPLDISQFRSHAFADRLALTLKFPFRAFPLMCVKPRKSNGSGLAFPSLFPALFGETSELDSARFVRVELQSELPQPYHDILQKTVCFRLRESLRRGRPHIALRSPRLAPILAPDVHPQVESVVQVDVGKQR